MKSPRDGFTLLELLASIAIISALVALLFPWAKGAVERGRQARCLGHMRQVGMALNQYADENRNTYPLAGSDATSENATAWYMTIAPYLNIPDGLLGPPPKLRATGVLICPSMKPKEDRSSSYGVNIYMMKNQSFSHRWSYSRFACPAPAGTILIGEKNYNTDQVYPEDYAGAPRSVVEKRHLNGANYIMLDGHAEYLQGPLPSGDSKWKWWQN